MAGYWGDYDGLPKTDRGQKALARLKEAEALQDECFRIRQAMLEGLLPGMTCDRLQVIQEAIERDEQEAAFDMDSAEYWGR